MDGEGLKSWVQVLQMIESVGVIIAAIVAGCSAVIAVRALRQTRRSAEVALSTFEVALSTLQQTQRSVAVASFSYTRTGLRDVVYRELSEREFNMEIPGRGLIKDLRTAKKHAREAWQRDNKGKSMFEQWAAASHADKKGWENRCAFLTAEGLQQVGLAAMTGAIPLDATLANVADVIFDDWLIAAPWIRSYQKREAAWKMDLGGSDGVVPYHRRHAEWIFLVALAWFRKQRWLYPDAYKDNPHIVDAAKCARRLEQLSKADDELIPESVKLDVKRLTGISI